MESLDVSNKFEEYLCNKAVAEKIPISGTFELLPLCNMNCKMCYIRLSKKQMEEQGRMKSAKEWISIAKEAASMGTLFILLTGGEPLLHPEFKEIYLNLLNLGIYVTINTNGAMIDESMANFFAEHMPRRINITLYGKDSDTYQNVCGDGTCYERTINAIKLLKERGVPVKLNATISKDNIQDFTALTSIANNFQFPIEIPYYLFPQNRKTQKTNTDEYRLSPKQAAQLKFDIVKQSFGENEEGLLEDIKRTLDNLKNFTPPNILEKPKGFWCRAGVSSFWINWKGTMTSCGMLEAPFVNLEADSFSEAWSLLLQKTGKINLPDQCFCCKYRDICGICAASTVSETGSFEDVPTYRCEIAKEYETILKNYISDTVFMKK